MDRKRMPERGNSNVRLALVGIVSALGLLLPLPAQAAPQLSPMVARAALPSDRLHFGLANSPGTDFNWLVASGVPWHYRYQYLAGGVNTGGVAGDPCGANAGWQTWNSPAGQFVTDYITASVAQRAIPVFTYYEIVQSNPSPGTESAELTKISTLCTMQAYWADVTVLMQKVGASGAQVVVHVEPDFWGFMEQQNADPTMIPAVVASSGNADLAGLPNTVAGMGLAFLKLRDKYAPNALLGIHASSWASNVDIATDQRSTIDPAAEADKVIAFINKAGLVGNPSGITPWDVIFNDVADHDAAWYGAASNPHWWDRNNVLFPNFTRWLAFMNRMHTDTGLPLIEWQVPVGNQYFDTMNNTDGHYQDNRAEYFIAHPAQLTAAGIVAVLFGKANAGQTNYWDEKADGITNPAPVTSWQCNQCNNHTSTVADDDGGFLRMAVGAYYRTFPGTSCNMFPSDSVFNTDISSLPVNTQSATWMSNMAQNANLHPDMGTVAQQYGMPVNVAQPPTTSVTPTFLYNSDSDHPTEGYPIDQSTLIEGGPGAPTTSDRHALVINKNLCKLYELFNLQNFTNGQTPSAGSGATWDLSSNAMRTDGFTSADAAGLPITPLLLRPDEIQAGLIAHAIRFTAHCTSTYIWPASHQAGSCSTAFPPMGARFRLRSSYDISSFSPTTQTVLRAFQHYGLVLADNGSDWFFGGTTDDWWGTTAGSQVISELKTIPAAQFDAIDESAIQVATGSYAASSTTSTCGSPTLSAAPPSTATSGSTVTFTASVSGCPHPVYQFWTLAPGSTTWTIGQPYSSTATFSWNTAGLVAGSYRYTVWVRDASSTGSSCNNLGCFDSYFPATAYTLTTTTCASVTESAAPPSPSAPGTTVTFTAGAPGCANPLYQFWTLAPGSTTWTISRPYSTTATFNWNTTGLAGGSYRYTVWVRNSTSAGTSCNNLGCFDAYFPATAYTLTTSACTSVSESAAPPSTATAGTSVTFTGSASGCPSPLYQFWVLAPGSTTWMIGQAYSPTATFNWNTTGKAAGTYRYTVWVRNSSSTGTSCNNLGCFDTYFAATTYTLTSTPCSSVTESAAPVSTAAAGTTVVFTASASGCANPQYQFWILAPGSTTWTIAQAYSPTATFTWNTTGKPAGAYRYTVWVRDASSAGTNSNNLGTFDTYFPATSYTLS